MHWIGHDDPVDAFPPPQTALTQPSGLLAAGGDLSPERLLAGYRRGIFPWYEAGQPILWWCPDPRTVLPLGAFHVSRSLSRTLRRAQLRTTLNQSFAAVIDGCAADRPGQHGTWITPQMRAAYLRLHKMGFGHSVETWLERELVGGIYGVAIGRMFFAESMFSRHTDASKVALHRLVAELRLRECPMIDCQISSAHLTSMGACEISRQEFVDQTAALCAQTTAVAWPAPVND